MTVKQLIAELSAMPPDATVVYDFNGSPSEFRRARVVRLISSRPAPPEWGPGFKGLTAASLFERYHPETDPTLQREDAVELI